MADATEEEFPALSGPFPEGGLSDADMDAQGALKQEAADAMEDGDQAKALEKYTAAIVMGTDSALLYCRRAQLLLTMGRPGACANDCTAALAINPDSGKAYKLRGKALAKQEKWEEAHVDLSMGLKIDYDDDTDDYAKDIGEKARNISETRVKTRVAEEAAEEHKLLMENKRKYEEGMKAREGELRQNRMDEQTSKEKVEQERQARRRKREEEEAAQAEEMDADATADAEAAAAGSKSEEVD